MNDTLKNLRTILFAEAQDIAILPTSAMDKPVLRERAIRTANFCILTGLHHPAHRIFTKHGDAFMGALDTFISADKLPLPTAAQKQISTCGITTLHPVHSLALAPSPNKYAVDHFHQNADWAFRHLMWRLSKSKPSEKLAAVFKALPVMQEAQKLARLSGNIVFLNEVNSYAQKISGAPQRPKSTSGTVALLQWKL